MSFRHEIVYLYLIHKFILILKNPSQSNQFLCLLKNRIFDKRLQSRWYFKETFLIWTISAIELESSIIFMHIIIIISIPLCMSSCNNITFSINFCKLELSYSKFLVRINIYVNWSIEIFILFWMQLWLTQNIWVATKHQLSYFY